MKNERAFQTAVAAPLRKMSTSIRREGIVVTARKVIDALREPCFDLVHRTDTSGRVDTSAMDVSGPSVSDAYGYDPTSHHELRLLFRRLELLDRGGVFVDFGCGKGRVLLVASDYRFDRVVGVEFSGQLCAVARANVKKYCSSGEVQVEIFNENAVRYTFSDEETVFFFFNPFREAVMSEVLENIYASLRRRNRQVWVIYSNPRCRFLFESGGIFLKVGEHRLPRNRAFVYTNVGTDPAAVRLPSTRPGPRRGDAAT